MTNGYCTLRWQASDLISASNLRGNSTKSVFPLVRPSWRTTWRDSIRPVSYSKIVRPRISPIIYHHFIWPALRGGLRRRLLGAYRHVVGHSIESRHRMLQDDSINLEKSQSVQDNLTNRRR